MCDSKTVAMKTLLCSIHPTHCIALVLMNNVPNEYKIIVHCFFSVCFIRPRCRYYAKRLFLFINNISVWRTTLDFKNFIYIV